MRSIWNKGRWNLSFFWIFFIRFEVCEVLFHVKEYLIYLARHIACLSLLNYCQNSLTIIRTSCWFSIHADFMMKFWYESVHSLWIFNVGMLLKCIYFNKKGTYTTCVFALFKIKWKVCKMNDFENCTSLAWHQSCDCDMYHFLRFLFRMQCNYNIVLNDKIDWFQY